MIDSARRRLFARNGKSDGFALFDLMTGKTISAIDDTDDGAGGKAAPPKPFNDWYPVGLVNDNTQAVIFKPGAIELWDVDPPRLAKRVPSPFSEQRFAPVAVGGTPGSAYTDKHQWEWSPDRRTLAVAYTEEPMQGLTQYLLIDAATLEVERLTHPNSEQRRSHTGFAFSPDHHWLAVGDHEGFWLYDRTTKEWVKHIAGEQHRSNALAPMRFIADSSRLIALGDQLQVSVYDVPTGTLAGRHQPAVRKLGGRDQDLRGRQPHPGLQVPERHLRGARRQRCQTARLGVPVFLQRAARPVGSALRGEPRRQERRHLESPRRRGVGYGHRYDTISAEGFETQAAALPDAALI